MMINFYPISPLPYSLPASIVERTPQELLNDSAPACRGARQAIMLASPPVVLTGGDMTGEELLNRDTVVHQCALTAYPAPTMDIATLCTYRISMEAIPADDVPLVRMLLGPLQRRRYCQRDPITGQPMWKTIIRLLEGDSALNTLVSERLFGTTVLERRHYYRLLGGNPTTSSIEKYLYAIRHNRTTEDKSAQRDSPEPSPPAIAADTQRQPSFSDSLERIRHAATRGEMTKPVSSQTHRDRYGDLT